LIRGEIEFDTTELEDFVIAKSLEEPLYHLAVVIDDFESGVTHVIRGEDGISNTPRQILIQEAIGAPRPIYAHLPLILAPDRSKLSKRKHGESVSINFYREKAYFPEAILNYLALLGWNPGDDREIFSLEELVQVFDLSKVQKGGAIFNIEKLNWFNKQYLQKLSAEEKLSRTRDLILSDAETDTARVTSRFEMLKINSQLINLMTERISTLAEFRDLILGDEFDYFFGKPVVDKNTLLWKGESDFLKTKNRLISVLDLLKTVHAESFTKENVKNAIWPFAEKEGRGEILWPMRISLSGKQKSPDPFVLAEIFGKEETISRLQTAINLLS
jgi:glutamyl-tRNA synthetase